MPPGRLELPLRCRKQILSLPRLPIPPQGHRPKPANCNACHAGRGIRQLLGNHSLRWHRVNEPHRAGSERTIVTFVATTPTFARSLIPLYDATLVHRSQDFCEVLLAKVRTYLLDLRVGRYVLKKHIESLLSANHGARR